MISLHKLFKGPTIMLHCFLLRECLQLAVKYLIVVRSVRRLIVVTVAQSYHETVLPCYSASCRAEDVVPFKPPCVATYEALRRVIL